MKQFLYIILLISVPYVSAQVFDTETIKNSGDNDKRINLVILGDGYTASELPQFEIDAIAFKTALFNQSPFKEYANYFNVHIVKVPSNQSGADHPGTATDVVEPKTPVVIVDTYFNATFDSFEYHRLLYYEIDGFSGNNTQAKIYTLLANNFPTYDLALILVNSSIYGGSGGEFPMASKGVENGISATEIGIHELGHSFANLKDEYYGGDIYVGEAPNMTQQSSPSLVRWKNWLGTNGVGIFAHSGTAMAPNWYRPHQNCKMRYLGVPFCSICKEAFIEKIHSLQSPIESYLPVSNAVTSPSYPLDFHMTLIKPIPNTLKSKWVLNTVDFANDVDDVSVLKTDLTAGMNTLSVAVNDVTTLLKVDNHDTFHVSTVTWTIDNSALGLTDITSEVANYSITMYPNPSNTTVNIKLETNTDRRLKVDILSLDGKNIKTISITNYETNSVDISNLSTGIYLANFYSNNLLIASKKLVKN